MKKVNGIVISIIIALFCISTMPFSVFAEGDQILASQFNTNNIIGIQVDYSQRTYYDGATTANNIDHDIYFILDDYYIGKIDTLTISYVYGGLTSTRTYNNVGVNGTSFMVSLGSFGSRISNTNISITTLRYSGQFYTKSSFLQIFPFESFAIQAFNLSNNPIVGINNQYQYKFNLFKLYGYSSNSWSEYPKMHQFYGYTDQLYTWIFWIDKNIYDSTTFVKYISLGNNLVLLNVQVIDRFHYEGHTTSVLNVTLRGLSNGGNTPRYISTDDALYMPIYFNLQAFENVSTDFALQFGLNNRLLNALDNISGTVQSDQAANDLDNSADDMQYNFDHMFTIEDQYNQDLNNQIDNIDFTNPLSGNQSLLSSGNFVIQVFNGLISNNPISLLIIIACILFVARRLFG